MCKVAHESRGGVLSEVLSMFVLRASPVFLGEMNGTATALVRCCLSGVQGWLNLGMNILWMVPCEDT